jgi:hypothetical protein
MKVRAHPDRCSAFAKWSASVVAPIAISAVVIATKLYLTTSPAIRVWCIVDRQAQNRYNRKFTRAPAMNAVMLATWGPVPSAWKTRASVIALVTDARAEPTP